MNKKAVLPLEPSSEPAFDLEKRLQALDARLSASGPTVKVMAPPATTVFKATLPQGRRSAPKSRAGGK